MVPVRWQAVSCVAGSTHGWLGLWGSGPRRTGLSAATNGRDDAGRRAHSGGQLVPRPGCRASPRAFRAAHGRKRLRRALQLPPLETFEDRRNELRPIGLARPRAEGGRAMRQRKRRRLRAGESAYRVHRVRRWRSVPAWTGRAGRSSAARRWGMRVQARAR